MQAEAESSPSTDSLPDLPCSPAEGDIYVCLNSARMKTPSHSNRTSWTTDHVLGLHVCKNNIQVIHSRPKSTKLQNKTKNSPKSIVRSGEGSAAPWFTAEQRQDQFVRVGILMHPARVFTREEA
jgi:hypothetical protein